MDCSPQEDRIDPTLAVTKQHWLVVSMSVICLSALLSGCAGMLLLSAASAGAVVHDGRSLAEINHDLTIDHDVGQLLTRDPLLKEAHIIVSSFQQVLFLGGEVPELSLRKYAEERAMTVGGITRVYNQITVGPNNTLNGMAEDSWLTAKIKAKMLAKSGLKAGGVKVISEKHVVYLMGKVTHDQANLAVDVARRVDGVRRVVKLFSYTD